MRQCLPPLLGEAGTRTANIRNGRFASAMDRRHNETPAINWAKYPLPRVRHHVSPQVYLPLGMHHPLPELYPPESVEPAWAEWFLNGRPADVLDVGCGRGAFLLGQALATPELNILGLDVRKILVEYVNSIANGENIKNAHAVWFSVSNGLGWIQDSSVQYVTYLFADPWPKKRHHKRRAFTAELAKELHRVLKPDGCIWFATDRPEVDKHQREILGAGNLFSVHETGEDNPWPFVTATDQQLFCLEKSIPFTRYYAKRRT